MKVLFTGRCLIIGDDRFESSWKALARDAHGIIFVFDPEKESHARQLEVSMKSIADFLMFQKGQVKRS